MKVLTKYESDSLSGRLRELNCHRNVAVSVSEISAVNLIVG